MTSIITRIKALNLPSDQFVVIGSGLLDAYGIREADDIDLVVSDELFAQFSADDRYTKTVKHDEICLMNDDDDTEIWQTWMNKSFQELYESGRDVDGVKFANPAIIIEFKRQRASEKDLRDIALLEEYEKRSK